MFWKTVEAIGKGDVPKKYRFQPVLSGRIVKNYMTVI
jgi:hypothetical protein